MVVITLICHREQALIEPALICPALVSPNQQDRLSLRIKGKGHSPDLTVLGKPKFFHVGVLRALQGVERRLPQIGSKLSQQLGVCQQFVLKLVHQGFELGSVLHDGILKLLRRPIGTAPLISVRTTHHARCRAAPDGCARSGHGNAV